MEPPPAMVDAFHCRVVEHPEYEEQVLLPSLTSTGAVGGVLTCGADKVKEFTME